MAEEKTSEKEEKKPTPTKDSTGKEEKSKEVKVPEKFKKLIEEIEKMQVVDLAELVKILEKKFGVSATAPVAIQAAGAGPAQGAEAGAEEKSVFNIELTGVGEKKIDVIKAVRDVMGKGLKESKDLVDAAEKEAQMIKENVKKEEAEEIKKKFEAAGAKVELK
jgi:large subunit ribosomal protein L7/L12